MKILAFTMGDSNKSETWSSVPYYFLKTLEEMGDTVCRENIRIEDSNKIFAVAKKIFNRAVSLVGGDYYSFERTCLYNLMVRQKMKKAYKKFQDVDLLLSFDFSHSIADMVDIPTVLLCDWTIEYGVKKLKKRQPTMLEKIAIKKQDAIIRTADYTITLFPKVEEYLKSKNCSNVHYMGHIINSTQVPVDMNAPESKNIAHYRFEQRHILFVGRKTYMDAAEILMEAIKCYNTHQDIPIFLDVIGMDESQFCGMKMESYPFVKFYGYLHKDIPEENTLYNKLIDDSMYIVNTAERWVGASSIVECMYFGLPILVTPNEEMIGLFGKELNCGRYNKENTVECVYQNLIDMLNYKYDEYLNLSKCAQKQVLGFTWGSYAKKFHDLIENKGGVI